MKDKKFSFRFMTYQENDKTYTAVCLDLDIVEEGHATMQEAMLSINEAVTAHLHAAAKLGFPKELIERPAPEEYWKILYEMVKIKPKKTSTLESFKFYRTSPYVTV